MSVYLGNNLLAGTPDITGKANTSLNNLDSTGQAVIDGKVNLNAANLSTAGKSLISGLGMPSDVYEDVTAGASGTTYEAPANGYFTIIYHITGSNNWCNVSTKDPSLNDKLFSQAPIGTGYVAYSLSVKKGDYAGISFGSGVTVTTFRFYYAEGEDNV